MARGREDDNLVPLSAPPGLLRERHFCSCRGRALGIQDTTDQCTNPLRRDPPTAAEAIAETLS